MQRFHLAPFILALCCFLLPFIKLSCAIDPSRSMGIQGAKFVLGGEMASSTGKGDKIEPDPWAIAGFALTVAALVAAVAARGAWASGLAVAALIALVVFKVRLADAIRIRSEGAVLVEMDVGLMAALLCLAVGAGVCAYLPKPSLSLPPR